MKRVYSPGVMWVSFYRFDTTGIGKILYRHMQAKLLFELGLNKQVRMNHTKSVMHDGFLYWGVKYIDINFRLLIIIINYFKLHLENISK